MLKIPNNHLVSCNSFLRICHQFGKYDPKGCQTQKPDEHTHTHVCKKKSRSEKMNKKIYFIVQDLSSVILGVDRENLHGVPISFLQS